jgi:quinolinate synthase
MVKRMRKSTPREFIVARETGMLHRLHRENPEARLFAANEAAACGHMKMITPAKLVRCLETGQDEIEVPAEVADKARLAIERMIAIA